MNQTFRPKSALPFLAQFSSLYPPIQICSFLTKSSKNLADLKANLITLFNSMRNPSGNPELNGTNSSDYELELVSALKSCSALKATFQGRQIHSVVMKTGLTSNIFINNSLTSMYVKCGQMVAARVLFDCLPQFDAVCWNIMLGAYVKSSQLDDACKIFGEMPEKGCVAYTTMIMGMTQNDQWHEAISLFKDMRVMGVTPNETTMGNVISSYINAGGILDANVLHGFTIKLGLRDFVLVSTNLLHFYCLHSNLRDANRLFNQMPEKNIVSWNVMLNGYSKAGLVDLARGVFDKIPEKDIVSWGTIIDAYIQVNCFVETLKLYRSMLSARLVPNDVMIVNLVSACGGKRAVIEGMQLHATIVKTGFDCYDFVQSTIIHFYSTCGKIDLACLQFEVAGKAHIPTWNALISGFIRNDMLDQARQHFDQMPDRDVFSWSSIISGYSQCGHANVALEMFQDMVAAGIRPNEVTMVGVLSAIASLGVLKEVNLAHEYIKSNSITLNDNLNAAIIDAYAKCGSISNALDVFNLVKDKVTTISPWNAIICGLAMHGHATMSLTLFEALEKTGIKPNSITFIGVLAACCHVGLVEAGEKYFESMKNVYRIHPNIKHYGCMVDLLGRTGRLQEAEEMITNMPMEADVVIWGTLLAACRTHGNLEIGERAAERLASLDMSHGASRVLLSNLYADAGRWNDASGIRKAMQGQVMIRSPGASGIA